jgi:hypothetical protein
MLRDQPTDGRDKVDWNLHEGLSGILQRGLILGNCTFVRLILVVFKHALDSSLIPTCGEFALSSHGFLLRRRKRASLDFGPIS